MENQASNLDRDIFYSVSSAAKAANVSHRQLYYWEHLGIVKPVYEKFGSYSYRRYTQQQINLLIKVKDLLISGYTLQAAIKKAKENGAENGGES
jgi:DNA-binding transcriptional MerR regulator